MPTDLTVYLQDRPGQAASVSEALGAAEVNISGMFALVVGNQGIVHLLVDEPARAYRALTDAGYEARDEQEVLVVDLEDRPGALGEVTRRVADAGANVTVAYLATGTRLVLGVDDLERARAALAER